MVILYALISFRVCIFFFRSDIGSVQILAVRICIHQARRKRSTMNFMERMEVDSEHKQAYAQAGNKHCLKLCMC